jgi:hypothetical protein
MTPFPVTSLPTWPAGGIATPEMAEQIAGWASAPAFAALVEAFGGTPPDGDIGARLGYLEDFSIVWDSRAGAERLDTRYVESDEQTRRLVAAAAAALGLTGYERPAADRYDHVLVLGGGPVTGRARARFAADLLDAGVNGQTVSGLGSLRPLPVSSAALGDGIEMTEGDGMLLAVQEAFPPLAEPEVRSGSTVNGHGWWVKSYPAAKVDVRVLAAPPTRLGQRANTADTMVGWAELVTAPGPGDRILVITTDLYVPFQHAEAIRTLGLAYRCGIETVGFSTRTFHGWPKGPSHTGELLQEIRSAIRSMRALHNTLVR